MKKLRLLIIFIFLNLILSPTLEAFGVGISPSKLKFGTIEPSREYTKRIIILNPNDFGIEYQFLAPKGIKISPEKGIMSPQNTKSINLTFKFNKFVETANLVLEAKRIVDKEQGIISILPAVAVRLEYTLKENTTHLSKNDLTPPITGATTSSGQITLNNSQKTQEENYREIIIPRKNRLSRAKPQVQFSESLELIIFIALVSCLIIILS